MKSPGDIRILTNDGDSTLGNIVYKKLLQSGPIISDVFKKNDQNFDRKKDEKDDPLGPARRNALASWGDF